MAELLKNLFNKANIRSMAGHLARVSPDFDANGFSTFAIKGLDDLELKERSKRITDALGRFLPDDFSEAVEILLASLDPITDAPVGEMESGLSDHGIGGWPVMSMADYVARHGQENVALSLAALKEMTTRFSAEFAIRPFLLNHQKKTLKTLSKWTDDKNEHVRRLVSEGSRPRLPWGIQLKPFIEDPTAVLQLLERLKDDPSEYVRRSVANNLNDIAKDHADLIGEIAGKWIKDAGPDRKRLVRHGLRTLIKAGHGGALQALGYGPAKVKLKRFEILTPDVQLGATVEFDFEMVSTSSSKQPLIVDYAIHHMRANGKTSPKVFKWKTVTLKGGDTFNEVRRHAIRPITTRRYYPGLQRVEILVNGESLCSGDFNLRLE